MQLFKIDIAYYEEFILVIYMILNLFGSMSDISQISPSVLIFCSIWNFTKFAQGFQNVILPKYLFCMCGEMMENFCMLGRWQYFKYLTQFVPNSIWSTSKYKAGYTNSHQNRVLIPFLYRVDHKKIKVKDYHKSETELRKKSVE